jgi:phosphatidylethanolamine-binding protein (PEBP) family uncharacterized protein
MGDIMKGRGWILAAALTALFGSHEAFAAGAFTLTSSDFKDGERLPQKFAGNNKSNPNCVGENISPELSWSNPPDGTKSFVLLMFDPEGRPPGGVSHFVAYDIPAGAPHHYTFTLIATDLDPKALKEGLTRDEVIKELDGHAKVATGLIGTFSHPQ